MFAQQMPEYWPFARPRSRRKKKGNVKEFIEVMQMWEAFKETALKKDKDGGDKKKEEEKKKKEGSRPDIFLFLCLLSPILGVLQAYGVLLLLKHIQDMLK